MSTPRETADSGPNQTVLPLNNQQIFFVTLHFISYDCVLSYIGLIYGYSNSLVVKYVHS